MLEAELIGRSRVRHGDKADAFEMNLDTVIIDLDKRHVTLRWCALLAQARGFDEYQVVAYTENRSAVAGAQG